MFVGSLNDLWLYRENKWVWLSGSNSYNDSGVLLSMGTESTDAYPRSRGGIFYTFQDDTLWIFGGFSLGNQDF